MDIQFFIIIFIFEIFMQEVNMKCSIISIVWLVFFVSACTMPVGSPQLTATIASTTESSLPTVTISQPTIEPTATATQKPLSPVITKDNIYSLTLDHQLGKGQPIPCGWSPNDETILIGAMDVRARDQIGTIYVYDTTTYQEISSYPKQPNQVLLGYMPDGESIALSQDKDLVIIDVKDGSTQLLLHDMFTDQDLPLLSFSADGTAAATVGPDENLHVYTLPEWKLKTTIQRAPDEPFFSWFLSLSPDSAQVAVTRQRDLSGWRLEFWDLNTGNRIRTLPNSWAHNAINPDWTRIAVGTAAGNSMNISIYEMDNLTRVNNFSASSFFLAFSPKGSYIVAGDRVLRNSDFGHMMSLQTSAIFSPDETKVLNLDNNGFPVIYSTETLDEIQKFDDFTITGDFWGNLVVSQNDQYAAFPGSSLTIRRLSDGELIGTFPGENILSEIGSPMSSDGGRVLSQNRISCELRILDTESLDPIWRHAAPCGRGGWGAALHPDGKIVAIAENYGISIYAVDSGELLDQFQVGDGKASTIPQILAFTSDGEKLVVFGNDGSLWTRGIQGGTPSQVSMPNDMNSSEIPDIFFSPDSRFIGLIFATDLIIRNIEGGEIVLKLKGGDNLYYFKHAEFSPDGKLLLVGFSPQYARGLSHAWTVFFDVDEWKMVGLLKDTPAGTWVSSGRFSGDGRTVITIERGTLRFYTINEVNPVAAPPTLPSQNTVLLASVLVGDCIDVPWATLEESDLILWGCHGDNNQQWSIEDNEDGTSTLKNHNSGKCLSAHGIVDGSRIYQANCTNDETQRWQLLGEAGFYQILELHSKKCVTVGFETGSSPYVQLQPCRDGIDQTWQTVKP